MNKVQVQNVKQFPEQNYTVATDLIEVCNLLSISVEQALHDLKSVLIHFSSLISITARKCRFTENLSGVNLRKGG